MNTMTQRPRRSLSRIERAILAIHGLVAAVVGIIGFIGANDPGFGDLQRIVIVMLVGLWAMGIVAIGLAARLIANQWARVAVLLVGPFAGILLVFGRSMLGW